MTSEAKKMVELKPRHFGLICIAAGMSFSEWYTIVLDTASLLASAIKNMIQEIIIMFI